MKKATLIRTNSKGFADEHDPYIKIKVKKVEDVLYLQKAIEFYEKMKPIPCSERNPEKSGDYLCQMASGYFITLPYSLTHDAWNVYDNSSKNHVRKCAMNPVAWYQIAELIKENKDENKGDDK